MKSSNSFLNKKTRQIKIISNNINFQIERINKYLDNRNIRCIICLKNSLKNEINFEREKIYTLQCGHKFHIKCILRYNRRIDERNKSKILCEECHTPDYNICNYREIVDYDSEFSDLITNNSYYNVINVNQKIHELHVLREITIGTENMFEFVILVWILYGIYFVTINILIPITISIIDSSIEYLYYIF